MKNLNINIRCNIYIVLLLFLCYNSVFATTAFVAMPGTGGLSISTPHYIIAFFRTIPYSLAQSLFFEDGIDIPFLFKTYFYISILLYILIPYFLYKEKKGKPYFYHYDIEDKTYFILIDVIMLLLYAPLLLIGCMMFSFFSLFNIIPLFLFVLGVRIYQYRKKLSFIVKFNFFQKHGR